MHSIKVGSHIIMLVVLAITIRISSLASNDKRVPVGFQMFTRLNLKVNLRFLRL
jgi:hypothetical protein